MKAIIRISLMSAIILIFQPVKSKTADSSRPWENPKLSLREQIEVFRKNNIKETKTVLKNDKYEVEILESVNAGAIWGSGPVQATVWDSTYGSKYTITLNGTKLNKAELMGNYLYTSLSFLGSTYSSDSLQVINLHVWKSIYVLEDLLDYEFSPDGNWFIYTPDQGKRVETLGDEVNIACLGKDAFSVVNLTGQEHFIYNDMHNRDEDGNLKPVHWPRVNDRSRTWNKLSNYLWDKNSRSVYFLAGEKGLPDEKGEMQFPKYVVIKVDMPQLDKTDTKRIVLEHKIILFSVKVLNEHIEQLSDIAWVNDTTILVKARNKHDLQINTTKWDKTWRAPIEKLKHRGE